MIPAPQAICFDAFETLVRLEQPGRRLAEQLARRGVQVDQRTAEAAFQAEVRVYRSRCLEACDPAGLAAVRRACAAALGQTLPPHTLDPGTLQEVLLNSLDFRLTTGAGECLDWLAARGLPLAVVSNWDCSLPEVLERLGILHHFRVVVASAVAGCEKPQGRIWEPALAALGAPAATVWHVGDEPECDVAGAAAAGLVPVLVGSAAAPHGTLRIAHLGELPALVAPRIGTELHGAA